MTTADRLDVDTAGVGCYRSLGTVDRDGTLEVFEPTVHTASGWGPNMQHGGPVSGLLTRAIERHQRPGTRISRVTVEILGVVPLSPVRVRSWSERPGRRVELLQAAMQAQDPDGQWRSVATAAAWQLATRPTGHVAHHADPALHRPVLDRPDDSGLDDAWRTGFVNALDWHIDIPAGQPGLPTIAWLRFNRPLVHGEEPTDLQRVIAIADIANGVGARLDARQWTFLNTDLTVCLFDPPTGPWIGLQAETSIGHDGIAMSSAVIHTSTGPVGRLTQNVLVQPRPEPLLPPVAAEEVVDTSAPRATEAKEIRGPRRDRD
ncbi:MAG: hypothetical protein QG597_4361 [Actinomycetota bacterium]|nr:hypothetical protein [Actinomycetota bacterium]